MVKHTESDADFWKYIVCMCVSCVGDPHVCFTVNQIIFQTIRILSDSYFTAFLLECSLGNLVQY